MTPYALQKLVARVAKRIRNTNPVDIVVIVANRGFIQISPYGWGELFYMHVGDFLNTPFGAPEEFTEGSLEARLLESVRQLTDGEPEERMVIAAYSSPRPAPPSALSMGEFVDGLSDMLFTLSSDEDQDDPGPDMSKANRQDEPSDTVSPRSNTVEYTTLRLPRAVTVEG